VAFRGMSGRLLQPSERHGGRSLQENTLGGRRMILLPDNADAYDLNSAARILPYPTNGGPTRNDPKPTPVSSGIYQK
jgi:hypothetical protein